MSRYLTNDDRGPDAFSESGSDGDPDSDSGSVVSKRDNRATFHMPQQLHDCTSAGDRKVKLILRDAHDSAGEGVTVEVPWRDTLQNVFDHFKARSCSICRSPDEMRFKTCEKEVYESDTPNKVSTSLQQYLRAVS